MSRPTGPDRRPPEPRPTDIHAVLSAVREHCRQRPGMEPPELERLANLLLRVFEPDPDYPVRAGLEHRTVRLHSLQDQHDPLARAAHRQPAPPEDATPSLQVLIARLLVVGNLRSARQREVARLHLWGYALPEIATRLDLPLSTVKSRWAAARRQLQLALSELGRDALADTPDPLRAISSEAVAATFSAAQQPSCYEPPRHCPEGRERCAHTGVCGRLPGSGPWR